MSHALALLLTVAMAPGDMPTIPEPSTSEPTTTEEDPEADILREADAFGRTGDWEGCIGLLEQRVRTCTVEREAGSDGDPCSARIYIHLGVCLTSLGEREGDADRFLRAIEVFQRIVDDAAAEKYRARDVAQARAKIDELDARIDELVADERAEARRSADAARTRERRKIAKGATLVSVGALLALGGGGLIGYGAAVVPQAREFGVEGQRPWRAYSAIGLGFGIAASVLGVAAITWGALTLSRRDRKKAGRFALHHGPRGLGLRF